jgi:hypothetical protein
LTIPRALRLVILLFADSEDVHVVHHRPLHGLLDRRIEILCGEADDGGRVCTRSPTVSLKVLVTVIMPLPTVPMGSPAMRRSG